MAVQSSLSPVVVAAFNTVMSARAIRSVYQPIVTLDGREVVGFEALARGPSGTVWHRPDALVSYAAQVGRLPELDWICRAAACRGALEGSLHSAVPLFVNVEPASSRSPCPPDLAAIIQTAVDELEIVAEVTERAVGSDPAGLLLAVEDLRQHANRIALDDVGADPSSQALMPLLQPDVIKLDRSTVQNPDTALAKSVVDAVAEQAAVTGAVILAEGIETNEHLATGLAMGATLGQGYLLGPPTSLPRRVPPPSFKLPRLAAPAEESETPFESAARHLSPRRVDLATVMGASRVVEERAANSEHPSVLLASFPHADRVDADTRARYSALAERQVLAAVYAYGMPTDPAPHLRGCPLTIDDPVAAEWNVLHVGAHAFAAMLAREVPVSTGDRQFDMIVTTDRNAVVAAARPLLRRLGPS